MKSFVVTMILHNVVDEYSPTQFEQDLYAMIKRDAPKINSIIRCEEILTPTLESPKK